MINISSDSEVSVRKCDDGQFMMTINAEGEAVGINFSPASLQGFLLKSVVYVAGNIGKTSEQLRLLRAPGYFIKKIDDIALQYFMRDRRFDDDLMVNFLWIMDDDELVELIMKNCTKLDSERLRSDLEAFNSQSPKMALGFSLEKATETISRVNEALIKVLSEFDE